MRSLIAMVGNGESLLLGNVCWRIIITVIFTFEAWNLRFLFFQIILYAINIQGKEILTAKPKFTSSFRKQMLAT